MYILRGNASSATITWGWYSCSWQGCRLWHVKLFLFKHSIHNYYYNSWTLRHLKYGRYNLYPHTRTCNHAASTIARSTILLVIEVIRPTAWRRPDNNVFPIHRPVLGKFQLSAKLSAILFHSSLVVGTYTMFEKEHVIMFYYYNYRKMMKITKKTCPLPWSS